MSTCGINLPPQPTEDGEEEQPQPTLGAVDLGEGAACVGGLLVCVLSALDSALRTRAAV